MIAGATILALKTPVLLTLNITDRFYYYEICHYNLCRVAK